MPEFHPPSPSLRAGRRMKSLLEKTLKYEIKNRWTGAVLFTADVSDDAKNGFRVALEQAVESGADLSGANLCRANLRRADLNGADLIGADLSGANLSGADLRHADLTGADLSGADLCGADLSGAVLNGAILSDADLTPIRDDMWAVLSAAPAEVPVLIAALKAGRVNGGSYVGSCACLVGTLANSRGVSYGSVDHLSPNALRPIERFFFGIRQGDNPETNEYARLALEWAEDWLARMQAAFTPTA